MQVFVFKYSGKRCKVYECEREVEIMECSLFANTITITNAINWVCIADNFAVCKCK